MNYKRVFLAVNNPTYREALADILKRIKGIKLLGKVGNGWEVVQLSAQLKPDIILIDYNLVGLNGIEAARALKKQSNQVFIVVLLDEEEAQFNDMDSSFGDWVYLAKDRVVEELPGLLAKINNRALGGTIYPPS